MTITKTPPNVEVTPSELEEIAFNSGAEIVMSQTRARLVFVDHHHKVRRYWCRLPEARGPLHTTGPTVRVPAPRDPSAVAS